jgi:hypothetical protein
MKNRFLKKNLTTLKEVNPELHDWITKEDDVDWIQQIQSKNKDPNILITCGSEIRPAYSMKNPKKEAFQAVKNMQLHKENVSIVIGFGLGYLTNAILSKMEKGHRIIIVEPVPQIIKLALNNFDFAKAIHSRDLILVNPKEAEISAVIYYISNQFVITNWLVTIDHYTELRPEIYGKLSGCVSNVINQIMCNIGTIAGTAGAKIADNDIACLPYVIRHRGVVELKGMFKDKPAVLVSTGPSLAKNIHNLIGMEDKVVIIAVGQALRVLLAYGIRPDFICTVDFGEVNMGHFRGLMDSDVPLVTVNRAYAPLLKAWQGPKFISSTPVPGFENMATGILTEKGTIPAGGSVAHLCFGLAQLLECNPIIFIGQDLALGETSHIAQADAMGEVKISKDGQLIWKVKDHRCSLHGEKGYSMGPITQVPGYYGAPVLTNLGLMSFLTTFEQMIGAHLTSDESDKE